jgi:pyruvate formate lyase activating enzyme
MIRAIIETSLIDWDGRITPVLFFDKCNFRCPFCQNMELIIHPERFEAVAWSQIAEIINKKEGWLDGIVLTGGEPLVDKNEVFDIIKKIKAHQIPIKLDSNGAYPELLEELVNTKQVDYVAMDIKAPLDERYDVAAGVRVRIDDIVRSVRFLMEARVEYEFRTTCVPQLIDEASIRTMGAAIKGARKWALQAYVPDHAYKEEYRTPLSTEYPAQVKHYHTIAQEYVKNTIIRGKI